MGYHVHFPCLGLSLIYQKHWYEKWSFGLSEMGLISFLRRDTRKSAASRKVLPDKTMSVDTVLITGRRRVWFDYEWDVLQPLSLTNTDTGRCCLRTFDCGLTRMFVFTIWNQVEGLPFPSSALTSLFPSVLITFLWTFPSICPPSSKQDLWLITPTQEIIHIIQIHWHAPFQFS